MKTRVVLLLCLALSGCGDHPEKQAPAPAEPTYPIYIEGGKRKIIQVERYEQGNKVSVLDTLVVSKAALYDNDSLVQPLTRFFFSYAQHHLSRCFISTDLEDYYNKAMLAFIAPNDALRIEYNNQDIELKGLKNAPSGPGPWIQTFQNDSMKIELSCILEEKRIMNRLNGYGKLRGNIGRRTFEKNVFVVWQKPIR